MEQGASTAGLAAEAARLAIRTCAGQTLPAPPPPQPPCPAPPRLVPGALLLAVHFHARRLRRLGAQAAGTARQEVERTVGSGAGRAPGRCCMSAGPLRG